jgi:hypothetical protein
MEIPKDPQVRDITERLRALLKKNNPKGLPENQPNTDITDVDFPTRCNQPKDPGFYGTRMITGSGGGPIL